MPLHHCPALPDLLTPQPSQDVEQHLSECVRCRALRTHHQPQDGFSPSALALPEQPGASVAAGTPAVEPADVVRIEEAAGEDYLVAAVLFAEEDWLTVIPISEQVEFATNADLLLDDALGFPAIAELWNQGTVLAEQVVGVLSRLPDEVFEQLDRMHEASVDGHPVPEDLPVGPEVISEQDPRLALQQQRAHTTAAFWSASQLVAEAESFPQLVELAEYRCRSRPDWQALLPDGGQWVAELKEGIDVFSDVPVAAMASLFSSLRLPAARPSFGLLHEYVLATHRPDAGKQLALARRRTGRRVGRREPDPEEARRAADQYVAALQRELANR